MNTTFRSLLRPPAAEPAQDQSRSHERLFGQLEQSALRRWRGDPVGGFTVGVATYSVVDMTLLDILDDALSRGLESLPEVSVFGTEDEVIPLDARAYLAGKGPWKWAGATPLVRVPAGEFHRVDPRYADRPWLDGRAAVDVLAAVFGFDPREVYAPLPWATKVFAGRA